jgi:hypothetical protein
MAHIPVGNDIGFFVPANAVCDIIIEKEAMIKIAITQKASYLKNFFIAGYT